MSSLVLSPLEAAARDAMLKAYAPYSGFRVGAAIDAGGRVFTGANMENASYGLSVCAERHAVAAAVFASAGPIDKVAVASTASPPASPCGMCRQVLAEFAAPHATVVAFNPTTGERHEWSLADLLPHAFSGAQLGGGRSETP